MRASVPLLWDAVSNAAVVTMRIAATSLRRSGLIFNAVTLSPNAQAITATGASQHGRP